MHFLLFTGIEITGAKEYEHLVSLGVSYSLVWVHQWDTCPLSGLLVAKIFSQVMPRLLLFLLLMVCVFEQHVLNVYFTVSVLLDKGGLAAFINWWERARRGSGWSPWRGRAGREMKSQRMLEAGEGSNWSRGGPSELVRTGGVREGLGGHLINRLWSSQRRK